MFPPCAPFFCVVLPWAAVCAPAGRSPAPRAEGDGVAAAYDLRLAVERR